MTRRELRAPRRFGWRNQANHAAARPIPRDPASLTAALRRIGKVEVKLLRQGAAEIDPHERAALGTAGRRASRRAVVREILLFCAGRPVVYGRTAIVRRDLRGAWRALSALGTRALGDFIFSDKTIVRGPFVVTRLAPADGMLRRIRATPAFESDRRVDGPRVHGARRRLIVRGGRAIVLTEVFLPDFPAEALRRSSRLPDRQ